MNISAFFNSTGAPRNLRQWYPRVLWDCRCSVNCVRHLRPLDVFSRLLVGPKCIRRWGKPSPLSAFSLELRPFRPQASPQKEMSAVSNQNCWKRFRFTEKVEKHWNTWYNHCVSTGRCDGWCSNQLNIYHIHCSHTVITYQSGLTKVTTDHSRP